ncbi:hypothetical protein ACWCQS_32715 [Streptomyces sp. NPDC002076]
MSLRLLYPIRVRVCGWLILSRSETRFRGVGCGFAAGSGARLGPSRVLLSLVYRSVSGLFGLLAVQFRSASRRSNGAGLAAGTCPMSGDVRQPLG